MVSGASVLETDVEGVVGTMGATGVEPTEPAKGDTPAVGMGAAELTPELLISEESSGIPVRGTPPMVVGEVDDGVDDAITLVDPDPHMPDIPDVSMIPDGAESPDVDDIAGAMPGDAAVVPAVPAVAGAADPAPVPPPSKVAADPNISAGAVPTVEQTAPLFGIAIVPVAGAASGLTPEDGSSVAPNGIPAGEIGEPAAAPSGDVASTVSVGVGMTVICANATFPTHNAGTIAVANNNFM
jgi:hypothetical protein